MIGWSLGGGGEREWMGCAVFGVMEEWSVCLR